MISARFFAFLVVCFAFAVVLSTPTPQDLAKRVGSDSTAVLAILTTVQSDVAKNIPTLDQLVSTGQLNDQNAKPIISTFVGIAVTALKSFLGLQLPINFVAGATEDDLVTVIIDIGTTLTKSGLPAVLTLQNTLSLVVYTVTVVSTSVLGL